MNNVLFCNYEGQLPDTLIKYNGNNVLGHGLITLCNPDNYINLVNEGYNSEDAIPFAVTAFGDILVWEKNKYVTIVSFSMKKVSVIESGFDFFFEDVEDLAFLKKYFGYDIFVEAQKTLGECKEDECYVCSPIPFIGGSYDVEKLSIGKIREYDAVCIEICGRIE